MATQLCGVHQALLPLVIQLQEDSIKISTMELLEVYQRPGYFSILSHPICGHGCPCEEDGEGFFKEDHFMFGFVTCLHTCTEFIGVHLFSPTTTKFLNF